MKLKLDSANPGSILKNDQKFEWIKSFNDAEVDISETYLKIIPKAGGLLKSELKKIEVDYLSETYQGFFDDKTAFRVIRPGKDARFIMKISGDVETLTIADMSGNGYAVHFDIVE